MYGRESVELFLLAIDAATPVVFDDGDSYVAHACPYLRVSLFGRYGGASLNGRRLLRSPIRRAMMPKESRHALTDLGGRV